MSAFLSPAVGVMNRLSVQGKLFLLGLIAMIPVVVLAFMLLERINTDIAFSVKETYTVPMVTPARQNSAGRHLALLSPTTVAS